MKQLYAKISLLIIVSLCTFCQVEAFSAKALGMGNTAVAYPQDSLSSAYNPANSACVGDRADSVVGALYTPGSSTVRNNPLPTVDTTAYCRRTWNPVGAFGLNKQVTENISAGFIVYNRFFKKTYYNKASALVGVSKIHHAYERYAASAVYAYNFRDCVQFGISLDLNVGHHKAGGVQNFDNPIFTVRPRRVTNKGYDWNWGLGVTVGALWEIIPELKVGVAFRPETKMSRFHRYTGFIPKRGIIHSPQELLAGFSWRALPCFTVAVDARYVWDNRLRAAHNPIIVNDPTVVKLGSKNGSAFGLKAAFFLRTGVDFAVTDELILRAGYIYAREVERKSQAFFDTLWNLPIENYLTLGSTYQWCSFDLDFFYIHGFEHKTTGINSIPPYLLGGDASHKRSLDIFGFGFGRLF